jgi:hypothetical protein
MSTLILFIDTLKIEHAVEPLLAGSATVMAHLLIESLGKASRARKLDGMEIK